MTQLEVSIGIANVGQRINLSDRDLKAAGGHQASKFPEHVDTRGFMASFRFHTVLSRGTEVDDGVDSIRRDAQLDCQLDVPATEGVNEGIDFPLGCSTDAILNPVAIENRSYAV